MQMTRYEDYKYYMQDTAYIYVGSKFTLREIMENEDIMYKFRKVIAESVMTRYDHEDSLETVLYYLKPDDFLVQLFKQMNANIKISIRDEKHPDRFKTRQIGIKELVSMDAEEKKEKEIFIQELRAGKLALLTV